MPPRGAGTARTSRQRPAGSPPAPTASTGRGRAGRIEPAASTNQRAQSERKSRADWIEASERSRKRAPAADRAGRSNDRSAAAGAAHPFRQRDDTAATAKESRRQKDEPQRSAWRHRLGLPVPQAGRRPGRSAAPSEPGRRIDGTGSQKAPPALVKKTGIDRQRPCRPRAAQPREGVPQPARPFGPPFG